FDAVPVGFGQIGVYQHDAVIGDPERLQMDSHCLTVLPAAVIDDKERAALDQSLGVEHQRAPRARWRPVGWLNSTRQACRHSQSSAVFCQLCSDSAKAWLRVIWRGWCGLTKFAASSTLIERLVRRRTSASFIGFIGGSNFGTLNISVMRI